MACNNNSSTSSQKEINNETVQFFQVSNFIQSQLDEIQKTPYFIFKKNIVNSKTDSTVINTTNLIDLAQPFLNADITPDIKKYYKESAFEDLTTKSITFNYGANKNDLPIQNIDILLHQETQKCKRIFIKKFYESGDTTFTQQLNWKANESFQIITSFSTAKNPQEQTSHLMVVWNNN